MTSSSLRMGIDRTPWRICNSLLRLADMSLRRASEWAPKWALRLLRRDDETVDEYFIILNCATTHKKETREGESNNRVSPTRFCQKANRICVLCFFHNATMPLFQLYPMTSFLILLCCVCSSYNERQSSSFQLTSSLFDAAFLVQVEEIVSGKYKHILLAIPNSSHHMCRDVYLTRCYI